jgi:hypothetical protein
MRRAFAVLVVAISLAACHDKALALLQPVNDARAAVKQRLGDDWNITLEIVEHSGKPGAYVCGYTEPPHEAKPGNTPALSDDHLFIYQDKTLTLADDVGKTALGDRVDKACPGFLRVKSVEPRKMVDLPTNTMSGFPR